MSDWIQTDLNPFTLSAIHKKVPEKQLHPFSVSYICDRSEMRRIDWTSICLYPPAQRANMGLWSHPAVIQRGIG